MPKVAKSSWIWLPHAAHLIVSRDCQFHLATVIGDHIVSTVGEWWPDRQIREIHAQVHKPEWLAENKHLKGDYFDAAYMKEFGFEDIGANRKYETMVFKSRLTPKRGCKACPYVIESGNSLDYDAYNDPGEAYQGHLAMCDKWSNGVPDEN